MTGGETVAEEERPLAGFRIGVTAARKAEEQASLLRRRGAEVEWGAALSLEPNHVDDAQLRAATEQVLAAPIGIFIATTGIGMKVWLDAARRWGLTESLLEALGGAEILARGPKSVGVLRRHGLRELWAPESECFDDVLPHLRGRDLSGVRIVVQEHGQSLSMAAHALRHVGAEVVTVPVYRVESAEDPAPMFRLVDLIADGELDAVTFTSAPAVAALMDAAAATGRRDEVTAAAFEMWGIPTIFPERSRLAPMIRMLELELPSRRDGLGVELDDGRRLLVHADQVLIDGSAVPLSPAPAAVLTALLVHPGHVVSRPALLAALPSGQAGSEHAVEMAVARLRAAIGTRAVATVVKRGYRLATSPSTT